MTSWRYESERWRRRDRLTPWAPVGAVDTQKFIIFLFISDGGRGWPNCLNHLQSRFPIICSQPLMNIKQQSFLLPQSTLKLQTRGRAEAGRLATKKCYVTYQNSFEKKIDYLCLRSVFENKSNLKRWLAVPESSFQFKTKVIYQNVLLLKSFKRVEAWNKNERSISFHCGMKRVWANSRKRSIIFSKNKFNDSFAYKMSGIFRLSQSG